MLADPAACAEETLSKVYVAAALIGTILAGGLMIFCIYKYVLKKDPNVLKHKPRERDEFRGRQQKYPRHLTWYPDYDYHYDV